MNNNFKSNQQINGLFQCTLALGSFENANTLAVAIFHREIVHPLK